MSKICTSIDQSKKLIELGVDVNTADMWYQHIGYSITDGKEKPTYFPMVIRDNISDDDIPAWSLSALLSILSTIIDYSYEFVFLKQTTNGRGDRLKNVYRCSVDMKDIWDIEPLDAAFEMVVWLKENGKI